MLFRYTGKVKPPLKRPLGLKFGWPLCNGMATNVLNAAVPANFKYIISAHARKAEQFKWITYKLCAKAAMRKPHLGADLKGRRVAPNLGEPDEGKLSCPVR